MTLQVMLEMLGLRFSTYLQGVNESRLIPFSSNCLALVNRSEPTLSVFFFFFFNHLCSDAVHNWTTDDSVQWLKESVELPQYEKNFRDFGVTGNTLPR